MNRDVFSSFQLENETRKPYVLQKVHVEKSRNQLSEGKAKMQKPRSVLQIGILIPIWKEEEF